MRVAPPPQMRRTWSFALVVGLSGCGGRALVEVDAGGAEDSSDGDSAGSERPDDDDDDFEPAMFDPGPDVGDGTLSHDLLVIAELSSGTLYMVLFAERLGDGLQGYGQNAFYVDNQWLPAGLETRIDAGSVVANEVSFAVLGHNFPAGQHPFGPDEATADLDFDARFYDDQLLCGTLATDVRGQEDSGPFVAMPLADAGNDPRPSSACR